MGNIVPQASTVNEFGGAGTVAVYDENLTKTVTDASNKTAHDPVERQDSTGSFGSIGSKGRELARRMSHKLSIIKQGSARWSLHKEGSDEPCSKYEQDAIFAVFSRCKNCAFPRSEHRGQEDYPRDVTKTLATHPVYPARAPVPVRRWNMKCEKYVPVEYTHEVVLQNDRTTNPIGWADPADPGLIMDELLKRTSFAGEVLFDKATKRPLNPRGRQGISGRGLLGKWGPNVAADSIVTRRNPDGSNGWQVVSILRRDTNQWALPGGFVDPGETIAVASKREFTEEAGNVPEEHREEFLKQLDELFSPTNARKVAEVYIDDPRNTDNAWMESTFYHMPCSATLAKELKLGAGDDAAGVHWVNVDLSDPKFANFYANHAKYVALALATCPHMM